MIGLISNAVLPIAVALLRISVLAAAACLILFP